MKPVLFNLLSSVVVVLCGSIVNAAQEPEPMAFSEIGAKASADYQGDAISVTATPEGASLRTGFQKLSGRVTEEGLWLESTEGACDGLSLFAAAVGRMGSQLLDLPTRGVVALAEKRVTWTRPGIVEEYSVSVDGVRQDFIVAGAPAGTGDLSVELALGGARAEEQGDGVHLTLAGSGRKLAYSRLLVTDATGRELPARLDVLSPVRLAVRVDDTDSAYPVRIDPTFSDADWVSMNPGVRGTNGTVSAMAMDVGGVLYVGGSFNIAGGVVANNIARWNGSEWLSLGIGTDGVVSALTVVGGNLYAGGAFTLAGGVTANNIAKWNGSEWSAFGSGMNERVKALAVIGSDLFAGGDFTSAGGVTANYIAKWNGSAWSPVGSGMNNSVNALAVSGSNLYAGGNFTSAGGVTATKYIAKWNGSAWGALGSGMSSQVNALAVSGTDLYVGGSFVSAGGMAASRIAKWDGSGWSALGSGLGAGSSVSAIAVSGSDLYVGGGFAIAGGVAANNIAKWNGSGWSPLGFGISSLANPHVHAIAVNGTDLYVGGSFSTADGVAVNRIAKWDGSGWSAFGSGANGFVHALAVCGSDLYAGGAFNSAGGVTANYIAKWNGSEWTALGSGMNNYVNALAVRGGDLYAGGFFTTAGGVPASRIAKWNGSAWSNLGSGLNNSVNALAVSGSDIFAGGSFTSAGGTSASYIAKWNGTAWTALGSGMSSQVNALAVSGSDLYAGGGFTSAGGVAANYIAKWNGTAWTALGSGMGSSVSALAVDGSDLYAGGSFTTAGGVAASRIAKWNGSSWLALGSGMGSSVSALAVSGSDLYAGGSFTTAGGAAANYIAKWNGSSWSALGSGMDSQVKALTVSGSDLYAGGYFTTVGSKISPYVAKAIIGAKIQVEQPVGSAVAHSSTKSFGPVSQGSSADLTFTIRNTGQAGLNLTGNPRVALSGTDASLFSVTAQPATPIATDATTTFTVRFAPTSLGIKNAHISVSSNAETPNYSILLAGEGIMAQPPVISSAASAAAYVGQSFSYQIAASNSPSSYGASVLPAGLSVNTGSGLISGTPSAAGTFSITLSATNAGGTGTRTLILTVSETSSEAIGSWRQQHFGTAENSGNAADLAAPDGDGIPNLVKYALLMTPGQDGSSRLPVASMNGGKLAVRFQRSPLRTEATIIVEAQSGLGGAWTEIARSTAGGSFTGSAAVTEADAGSGVTNVTVQDVLANASRRFMRVRVERQ